MERQKKLGPAPFASIEDLADPDLASPESRGYQPMPEICEDHHEASASTSTAQTPTTPRIDVEQASSPSQGESGDSTPERELFGVDSGHLSSGFLEGAADVDLRSSAEELGIPYATGGRKTPVAYAGSSLTAVAPLVKRKVSWDAGDVRRRQIQQIVDAQHARLERKGSSGAAGRSSAEPVGYRESRLSSISSGMSALSTSRRSPSPHRMLLETSFCGPKTQAAAAAEVQQQLDQLEGDAPRRPSLLNPSTWFGDSRCNSPLNSPLSPTSIRAFMIKYATEPRSRPTSPMGWASSATSPTPTPTPGVAASDSSRWLSSPRCQRRASTPQRTLVETSFCGQMQIQVPDDDAAPRGPSPVPTGSLLSIQTLPVKYATEPRSRPTSPTVHRGFMPSPLPPDARRGSQQGRCVSPMIETSFCGPKRFPVRQDSAESLRPITVPGTPSKSCDLHRTGSLKPVRYATEPRSRPTSPAPSICQPLDSPRIRARSPAAVETSFCGSVGLPKQESIVAPAAPKEVTRVSIHPQPVKYSTEPRSRSASPVPPSLLANHCPSPGVERRSPSPLRTVVETSFIGAKKRDSVDDQESLLSEPPSRTGSFRYAPEWTRASPVRYATEPRSRPVSPAAKLLSQTPETSRRRSPSPHRTLVETSFCGSKQMPRQDSVPAPAVASKPPAVPPKDRPVSPSASTDSISSEISLARHMRPDQTPLVDTETKAQVTTEFTAHWPELPVSQSFGWPIQMTTFEPPPAVPQETSPPQNSNGHIISSGSSVAPKPARHLPKPVACPRPPESFHPHPLESSPSASPVLARRAVGGAESAHSDTATPSPSSPFPSRRPSVNSGFFRHDEDHGADQSDDSPQHPAKADKKARSVLSVLFGKKAGKSNKNKDTDDDDDAKSSSGAQRRHPDSRKLTLPVQSRESSPGRSIGESGDDVDDDDAGFQHQILDAGNESGDNALDADALERKAPVVPHEEVGLFHQDSIEDELPYVPTTLPVERPVAPVITPVRMRISQMKMTPVERPRCSVTFAPRSITEFVHIARTDSLGAAPPPEQKIKVCLPRPEREESVEEAPLVPPVRASIGSVQWEAFSEQVFRVSRSRRQTQRSEDSTADDAPAVEAENVAQQPPPVTAHWVNVEELPEPVKEAKPIKVLTASVDKKKREPRAEQDVKEYAETEDSVDQQNAPLLQDDDEDVDDAKTGAALLAPDGQRKDSVCSETALLREIEEPDVEEDRSPQQVAHVDDETSASIHRERSSSSSSSLDELDSNLEDVECEAVSLVRNNLLAAAPFGMDLDVPSNRSSIAIPSDVPSPDELSISLK